MKKLVVIILLVSLVACSKSNVTPTYTSILGTWSFNNSAAGVSGQFNIINDGGGMSVEPIGSFMINGVKYTITNKVPLSGSYQISLQSSYSGHLAQVFFNPAVCNSKFNSMSCGNWQYTDGVNAAVTVSSNPVTLTR